MSAVVRKIVDMPTPEEMALLDFQDRHPKHRGAKEEAIRRTFHITPAQFYQRLFQLTARPDVIEEYPQLASRTMRLRSETFNSRARRSRMRER
jgi:hypothetical protein